MSSSSSLSPPPASRARSSSTNCRPPDSLRLCTLGRRTAALCPQQLSMPLEKENLDLKPQSMSHKIATWFTSHTPQSRSTTPEEPVLPISTPTQSSFPDISLPEKQTKSSSHLPLIIVLILFPLSTFVVLLALYTLPISVSWPRTVSDLVQLVTELHGYSQSGPKPVFHIIAVMSISAVWKHAWSIPGSVIWNVLAGALFSPALATVLLTVLTTIGSACSTLLAMPLAPYIHHFFPRALDMTRSALQPPSSSDSKAQSPAWVRLSILRLIGVVPWSGINIACGVCAVPLVDCMLGTFIGTLPWTAVTCQIGDILQTVASHPSPTPQTVSSLLTSPTIIAKLVLLSFLSLAPILARDRLKELIAGSSGDAAVPAAGEDRKSRSWVQEWKDKIRNASRSKTRTPVKPESELEILVREKEELMQQLPS